MKQTTAKMSELFEIDTSGPVASDLLSTKSLRGIPVPPSVNNVFKNVGNRRVRTKSYTKWRNDAAWLAAAQIKNHVRKGTPFEVTIRLNIVSWADIDNRIKPFLDMLQYAGIIGNDRYCHAISISRDPNQDLNTCSAEITGEWFK